MSTDPLSRLADLETASPVPDLAAVQRRARALRTARRRTRLTVGTVGLAAVLTVGGVVVPQLGGQTPGVPGAPAVALALGVAPARASDAATGCGSGYAEWADPDEWAADSRVTRAATLLGDAPWPLASVGVHGQTMDCPDAMPVAVLLDTDPLRGIAVYADVADPFPAGTDGVTDVSVRGVDGRLRDLGAGILMTWVDEAGVRWLVNGSGMTADDLVAVVDGLAVDGVHVDAASAPAAYEWVPVPDGPADRTTRTWWVTYGETASVESSDGTAEPPRGGGVELQAQLATAPPEVAVSYWAQETVLVDVGGHRAVFSPWGDPDSDVGGWLSWQADGVRYTVSGALPVEELADLARRTVPADVTDPRFAGLPVLPGVS
ncbi:hypothetical protein [Cellulomonas hominis]|uniref:hypothetical protein n=1 Tax=Cellulomonas hominis TaxID=156981 RepID=UPI001B9440B9|nr:hypothetical protein [Cellulomonas hominis]VTR76081.1 hypothetical protein CHMI_00837 [Cellulomonas hominis]